MPFIDPIVLPRDFGSLLPRDYVGLVGAAHALIDDQLGAADNALGYLDGNAPANDQAAADLDTAGQGGALAPATLDEQLRTTPTADARAAVGPSTDNANHVQSLTINTGIAQPPGIDQPNDLIDSVKLGDQGGGGPGRGGGGV
jgi:hypothetical protein